MLSPCTPLLWHPLVALNIGRIGIKKLTYLKKVTKQALASFKSQLKEKEWKLIDPRYEWSIFSDWGPGIQTPPS
jgi:hypothetical protein